ncbi:hypothetical protein MMC28_010064 [Mycoblastus sanguinarius]|nr:hypothetical protein [Mycoblastus sanguinarius]
MDIGFFQPLGAEVNMTLGTVATVLRHTQELINKVPLVESFLHVQVLEPGKEYIKVFRRAGTGCLIYEGSKANICTDPFGAGTGSENISNGTSASTSMSGIQAFSGDPDT